jgi:tRNA-modifying protein YgfZ
MGDAFGIVPFPHWAAPERRSNPRTTHTAVEDAMTPAASVYTDVAAEYRAATQAAAVYDASPEGRLKAAGADALDLLNRMSTNLVLGLETGQGAPTVLTTDRGRILDAIGVVNLGDYVLLLTSAGQQQPVIAWLDRYTIMEDLTVEDITAGTALLRVLGPAASARLEEACGASPAHLAPYHALAARLGEAQVQVINRPLGDLPSFDLFMAAEAAPGVWQRLVDGGVAPAGAQAYEAVRVQHAVPQYGREMGEAYNPLEAGLIGSINFHKGCYIGQEVIARLDTYQKVQKRLAMLRFAPDATPVEGASLEHDGQMVGTVTSVAKVPGTDGPVGLGYVRSASAQVGTRLDLKEPARGTAEIIRLPQLFGPGEG